MHDGINEADRFKYSKRTTILSMLAVLTLVVVIASMIYTTSGRVDTALWYDIARISCIVFGVLFIGALTSAATDIKRAQPLIKTLN